MLLAATAAAGLLVASEAILEIEWNQARKKVDSSTSCVRPATSSSGVFRKSISCCLGESNLKNISHMAGTDHYTEDNELAHFWSNYESTSIIWYDVKSPILKYFCTAIWRCQLAHTGATNICKIYFKMGLFTSHYLYLYSHNLTRNESVHYLPYSDQFQAYVTIQYILIVSSYHFFWSFQSKEPTRFPENLGKKL